MKLFRKVKLDRVGISLIFLSNHLGIVYIRGCFPFFVYFTNSGFSNRNVVAQLNFFCIRIRKDNMNDLSLIAHELTHARQVVKTCMFHFFLYNFSNKYRYASELEAYSVQILFILETGGYRYDDLPRLVLDAILDEFIFSLQYDMVSLDSRNKYSYDTIKYDLEQKIKSLCIK